MKQLLTLFSIAFLLVGCTADSVEEQVKADNGTTVLTLAIQSTRTSLGDKANDIYPVYWSEGDRIVVNGVVSEEAAINTTNASSAQFSINGTLKYPYSITYPYTSTTTADAPKVLFLAEQEYVDGTFCNGSAPMCGYALSATDKITMKHLSGALRFPVKASVEGVVLEKIVVSSESAKLSGEFAVNCEEGRVVPSASAESSVTYILPANFTLSTSEESIFYIALPAVEQGKCNIEFVAQSDKKMVCEWNSTKPISAGMVREFASIIYKEGTTGVLTSFDVDEDDFIGGSESNLCCGYVKDTQGNPIAGVAVSDGYSVVTTDAEGYYSFKASSDAWYIFVTVPAAYEIETDSRNLPCFYQKYSPTQYTYNFVLTPLEGGVERKFAIFTITDVHLGELCERYGALGIFENKAIPHINGECDRLAAQGIRSYGVNLGDYITNMGGTVDDSAHRGDILVGLKASKVSFFSVFGNHDHNHFIARKPLETDKRNSNTNIKAQREHEDMFGPVNYSFDRGNVHILCMRNIIFPNATSYWDLEYGFTDEQMVWLRQDLASVPKDKTILLCVHTPIFNYKRQNYDVLRELLNEYAQVRVVSGHNHYQRNVRHSQFSGFSGSKFVECNTAPVSGSVWLHNIAGDGTPAGYKIYVNEDGNFVDERYVSYNEGEKGITHQMRLYWGDAKFGSPATGEAGSESNPYGTKGFYAFNHTNADGKRVILANVYNYAYGWKLKVYENNVKKGEMTTKVSYTQPSFSSLVGDGSLSSPWRVADGTESAHDFYVTGYILGYLGVESGTSGAYSSCFHMWDYTMEDNDADIKVVATDQYGNTFTETVVVGDTDFSQAK